MIKASSKVRVRTESDDQHTTFFLAGEIDEEAEFIALEKSPKVLVLDLGEIRLINSCGLRNWIIWIEKIDPKTQIVLKRCPQIIVDQINILEGFIPRGAVIESFFVPYYCDECGHEDNILVTRGKDFHEAMEKNAEMNNIPDERQCPQCDSVMELGILPEKYFRFFKSKKAS